MKEKELIKRKETDLEITDFLWELLRRWRLLLTCILIGAVLLSGLQLVKDMKAAKATPEQVQAEAERTIEEMENALGAQDMDEVLGAAAMKKQLDEKSLYVKESPLMQINPYEENVIYLQYLVVGVPAGMDYACLYKQHISWGANMSELVDVVTGESLTYLTSDGSYVSMGSDFGDGRSSFVVRVRGLSDEACMETAELVKSDLEQYTQTLSGEIDEISLTLIEENAAVVVDEELAALQNQISTMIKQLNNNLDSLKSNMTGDQLALYVKYTERVETEAAGGEADNTIAGDEEITDSAFEAVRFSFTKLVIGAVLGMVLSIVWILLAFVFSSKLRSGEEIKTLYRANVLGNVRSGRNNKIDRKIMEWRYHRAGTLTLDEEVDLISANIKVACGNKKTNVYLTGSSMSSVSADFLNRLVSACKEKGIAVTVGREISYYADALVEMAEVGQVLFVEQLRISYYDEIYKEITTCLEHDIPVLGMVVMGA